MYKEFYEEDREWALGRIGGGRGAGEERVGDGSFNRVGIFSHASLCTIFLLLLFLYMDPFFPKLSHLLLWLRFSFFQFLASDHTIFLRKTSRVDHQTRQDLHNSQSDPPQIRQPYPSTTPDHPQTQQTNQTTRTDRQHHTRPPDQIIQADNHPWLLSFKSAHHNQSLGMVHVRCIPYGLGQGGVYRALDEPCKAYFPHIFGLKFPDFISA